MSEAEAALRKWRWPDTDGKPVCPKCGNQTKIYYCEGLARADRFKCSVCRHSFSLLSGTPFAGNKKPLDFYVRVIEIFERKEPGSLFEIAAELKINYCS